MKHGGFFAFVCAFAFDFAFFLAILVVNVEVESKPTLKGVRQLRIRVGSDAPIANYRPAVQSLYSNWTRDSIVHT